MKMTFPNSHPVLRLLGAGLLVALVLAIAAAPASAQGICDQYPNSPGCGQGPGGGGGNNNDDENGNDENVSPTANLGDGDGNLPFTGYPVTPLVLLLLALLATGLATRGYAAVRERRTASS
jgi:hypothetical protein